MDFFPRTQRSGLRIRQPKTEGPSIPRCSLPNKRRWMLADVGSTGCDKLGPPRWPSGGREGHPMDSDVCSVPVSGDWRRGVPPLALIWPPQRHYWADISTTALSKEGSKGRP